MSSLGRSSSVPAPQMDEVGPRKSAQKKTTRIFDVVDFDEPKSEAVVQANPTRPSISVVMTEKEWCHEPEARHPPAHRARSGSAIGAAFQLGMLGQQGDSAPPSTNQDSAPPSPSEKSDAKRPSQATSRPSSAGASRRSQSASKGDGTRRTLQVPEVPLLPANASAVSGETDSAKAASPSQPQSRQPQSEPPGSSASPSPAPSPSPSPSQTTFTMSPLVFPGLDKPGSPAAASTADVEGSPQSSPRKSAYGSRASSVNPDSPRQTISRRTMSLFMRPDVLASVGNNHYITEFNDWVQSIPQGWIQVNGMFLKEVGNPAGGNHFGHGHAGMHGITKKRWVRILLDTGYPSAQGAAAIFDNIAKESFGERNGDRPDSAEAHDQIFISQLKRFERRVTTVNSTRLVQDNQSPVSRFNRFLTKKYGSTLVAWRTVLDVHQTGRIAYSDFTNGCRGLLGIPSQGQLIWGNIRQDKLEPLEFWELDPKEGDNLEEFAECLWNTVGMDMDKAWHFLDINNQQFLGFDDFKFGVRRMGFTGNCQLLFKGMDSSRLGRLKRAEFDYIAKVSRVANRRLGGGNIASRGALTDLISWAQRELGGSHELLDKLGLGHGQKEILVGDLSARLTALGFEGDALAVATRVGRLGGGTAVNTEALIALLSGNKSAVVRHTARGGTEKSTTLRSPRSPRDASPTAPPLLSPRAEPTEWGWDDTLDYTAQHNRWRCKYNRGYFWEPPKSKISAWGARSARSVGAAPRWLSETMVKDERPAWDDCTGPTVKSYNEASAPAMRSYFLDTTTRPVRDARRELVQKRLRERNPEKYLEIY